MRIKKQFLNEESLKPYGFKKCIINLDYGLIEYIKEDDFCEILIQRCTGEIAVVLDTSQCDCADLNDVVYHLIKDGLVEL